jgi:bla regulator protein BlaR1
MASSLLELLARMAVSGSAAIVLVMLLRRPLRRFAGAAAAYQCWLVVALAMLAAALPALRAPPAIVLALAPALHAPQLAATVAQAGSGWAGCALLAWACGALGAAGLLARGQRDFVRGLGVLEQRDGIHFAAHTGQGPALLGLWRPRIVVPADFASRYSPGEQALIIAHESCHRARRDPAANAVLALLQCVFWFNPLIHIAASRCRFDQELACDAAVMARHGAQRQAYAAAMLKTQAGGATALATCHWQSTHPLKERIMQLKQTTPGAPRRRAGRLLIAILGCAGVLGTVAARTDSAAAGPYYEVAFTFGADATPRVRVKAGEEFQLRSDAPGAHWSGVFRITPAKDHAVLVKTSITPENGEAIAPSLLLHLGESGGITVAAKADKPALAIAILVKQVDRLDPGA